ncbi:hypothetical protein EMCG_05775 [[Emmonsia] crescens]|uniref:Uncharacterized protein n=1 Tax=[Emmonsia] crescens TaxID=73230 RepID=A0A0G2IDH1_9EURO|nr:hypothetical protein EMCG_05775 [Emmonsia crescens UAMH 3008]
MEAIKYSPTLGSSSTKLPPSSSHRESSSQHAEIGSRNHASSSTSFSLSSLPSSPEAPCSELLGKMPNTGVSPLFLPLPSMPVNRPVSTPTVTNRAIPSSIYPSVAGHTNFKQIVIHTAKCDKCNDHNKATLNRCTTCGFQICTPCWLHRGGGHHTVTRTFSGPVFDPNAVDEEDEGDEWNDEEDRIGDGDVSMSDVSEDVEDNDSDVMTVSKIDDEEIININDSDDAFSIHSIDEHNAPLPNLRSRNLDMPHRDQQTAEASQSMYIYSSGSRYSASEDDDSVSELLPNQILRTRRITRRNNRDSSVNQARNYTSDDESLIEINSQQLNSKNSDNDHLYYSDLAPESRERIDILISTAISLFRGATFDPQTTHFSISNINQRDSHSNSSLFVPIDPNDHLTPAYNERLSHLAHLSSNPRTSRRHPFDMAQREETVGRGQTTCQSLSSAPTAPPRKRKREVGDVKEREGVWKGPFLDESTDEEGRWGSVGCRWAE